MFNLTRPPLRVLLVDDDADTRAMLRLCLTRYGVEAAEAASAHDASPADIQRARDAGCDAVLVKPCPPQQVLLELQRALPSHFRAIPSP